MKKKFQQLNHTGSLNNCMPYSGVLIISKHADLGFIVMNIVLAEYENNKIIIWVIKNF